MADWDVTALSGGTADKECLRRQQRLWHEKTASTRPRNLRRLHGPGLRAGYAVLLEHE
jgi:hypothetical protein